MIVDALDECPNLPVVLTPRQEVLHFLQELVESISNLHVCVTSRLDVDINIKPVLDHLPSYVIFLHEEPQQIDDINGFITWFVDNDEGMQGWTSEVKKQAIDALASGANGM
jgi:hypothetical protein